MQRQMRLLSLALASGLCALIAAAVPIFATGATQMMIEYTQSSQAKMPGMMSMFVHPGATSETHYVSQSRERDDQGNTSQIVQCDLKRVIHLDNGAKTYYTLTFAQMQAIQQAAIQQYYSQAHQTPPPQQPNGQPIEGSGGFTLSVNTVNDPNTQQLFGMTAHHVTETITGTSTGTGQCPNGSMTMTNDEWYIPNQITFSCPLPRPRIPTAPANAPHGAGGAANPCFGSFQFEASGKAHTEDRFALKQDTTIDMGIKITTHEEVTKYQVSPYDPSVFDVPQGYTQVQPPSTLSGH